MILNLIDLSINQVSCISTVEVQNDSVQLYESI